jgi:hypothetical protein
MKQVEFDGVAFPAPLGSSGKAFRKTGARGAVYVWRTWATIPLTSTQRNPRSRRRVQLQCSIPLVLASCLLRPGGLTQRVCEGLAW